MARVSETGRHLTGQQHGKLTRPGYSQTFWQQRGAQGRVAAGQQGRCHQYYRLQRLGQKHAAALYQFSGNARFGQNICPWPRAAHGSAQGHAGPRRSSTIAIYANPAVHGVSAFQSVVAYDRAGEHHSRADQCAGLIAPGSACQGAKQFA